MAVDFVALANSSVNLSISSILAPIKDRDKFQHLCDETDVVELVARTSERHSANQSRVPSACKRSDSQWAAKVVVASGWVNLLKVER